MVRLSSFVTWGVSAAALTLLSACALIVGLNDALPRSDAIDSPDSAAAGDGGLSCAPGARACFSGSICEPRDTPQFGCGSSDCDQCHLAHAAPSTDCVGDNGHLACNIPSCEGHYADCNNSADDGCEVDESQAAHCLGCGDDAGCSGATPYCQHTGDSSSCVATCGDAGLCGTACVNKRADPDNCGGCNHECPQPTNSLRYCQDGTCGFACLDGSHFCGSPPTSCEQDQDPKNCGPNCVSCPQELNSIPSCVAGACVPLCNAGYGDCKAGNGCETNLTNDSQNCGKCGTTCAAGTSCCNGACSGGKCLDQQQVEQPEQPVQ